MPLLQKRNDENSHAVRPERAACSLVGKGKVKTNSECIALFNSKACHCFGRKLKIEANFIRAIELKINREEIIKKGAKKTKQKTKINF